MRRLTIAVDAGLVIRHQGAVADVELLPCNGNPPLVAGESAHGDSVAAIATAVCHVIVVRVRSLPRTRGCQAVLPVRRADLDMLRAAAHRRLCRRCTSSPNCLCRAVTMAALALVASIWLRIRNKAAARTGCARHISDELAPKRSVVEWQVETTDKQSWYWPDDASRSSRKAWRDHTCPYLDSAATTA